MINTDINTRTTLTIPKDMKSELEVMANEDRRSLNNLIITILDKHIKEHNKKE